MDKRIQSLLGDIINIAKPNKKQLLEVVEKELLEIVKKELLEVEKLVEGFKEVHDIELLAEEGITLGSQAMYDLFYQWLPKKNKEVDFFIVELFL